MQTVVEIRAMLQEADADRFAVLERALKADTRKGVAQAIKATRRRLAAEADERTRVTALYAYQDEIGQGVILGLDEVGRGPLAGPLTVGGVILPREPLIMGLNDSKQIPEHKRGEIADRIKEVALCWTVQHMPPEEIDARGMATCLRTAFKNAIADVESQGFRVDTILLDGNPLHLDPREVNVVKGDAKCASISAASIIAKVTRDSLMEEYGEMYPDYGFAKNKGYGSAAHIDAITRFGLTPIHRRSFCHFDEQPTLF
ncbi:MAG: ribonuclease HII [Coriobacteriia bacterium]|nr:ribonuclease HII [Coriobacteriia bacterium]